MTLEDAKRRVANEMDLLANRDDPLARDIIVVMRELGRLTDENRRLREALTEMVYETTHLSPQEEDGSHRCRISARALSLARAALAAEPASGEATHGSPELDADAAKLVAMGADPGPTFADIFAPPPPPTQDKP